MPTGTMTAVHCAPLRELRDYCPGYCSGSSDSRVKQTNKQLLRQRPGQINDDYMSWAENQCETFPSLYVYSQLDDSISAV